MQRSNQKLEVEKEILEKAEKFAPKISEDFLRKYISYARQNCFPVLSSEAMQGISDFYVDLREKGKKEGNYAATHRQLEALVRLSEASARIRLSDIVEPEDAERSIRIFKHSMEEVVVDPTTGKVDIDIITSGQAHSKTNELKKVLMIILGKAKEMDLVPLDDVYAEAASEGIDKSKVSEYVGELKRRGEIYEPTYGAVKPADKK
jgi:replicative DNA helicase Mcm